MSGSFLGLSTNVWVIIAAALVTYATRFGGHAVVSRFKTISPRVNAALNAVPAAVLTTLVAPAAVFAGTAEALAVAVALIAGLRLPLLGMFAVGWVAIIAFRAAGL